MITFLFDNSYFFYSYLLLYAYYAIFNVQSVFARTLKAK